MLRTTVQGMASVNVNSMYQASSARAEAKRILLVDPDSTSLKAPEGRIYRGGL